MQQILTSFFQFRRPTPVSYALAAIVAVAVAVGLWQTRAQEGVPLSELTRQTHLHGIAVDPNDPSVLILATHHGVWRLEGETARRVSDNRNDYMGFTPHPSDPDTFFASGHPETGGNMGFIVSRDGGRSWEQLSEGAAGPVDFHAMDVSAADPDVMYGLYGMVQRSRDGGESWQVRGEPPADVFALAASSVDAETVYAATRIGVMVSRDGGASWEPLGGGGQPASLVETTPDGGLYAFIVGEGLVRAEEARLEWQQLSNDFGDQVLLHLAVDPRDSARLYAVSQHGAVLASADGGRSWRTVGE
ncbi:MAG TPA: exo-alpha-sialidase [Afifellaceae bacterium]|nr:exo-alpha-sialidase [Afifellaceae bacterium]